MAGAKYENEDIARRLVKKMNSIQTATLTDIPALLQLLNSAYRGESSKQGWTTEAHLIAGEQRTDAATLQQVIEQPGSVILKIQNANNEIIGCVNLQKHEDKLYLGMLSVSPALQGGGLGKELLHAAEDYAKEVACNKIYMGVVSVRAELIDWYKRHGYVETGERKPFVEDSISGKHLQELEFLMLEKNISIETVNIAKNKPMDLQQQFEEAKAVSKTLSEKPDNETLLQLYSLYKQGSEGDVNTEAPSNPFDFVARAKYEAWEALKGKTKEEAMQGYIELVNKLATNK
jgi:acyl-CoA-binding protein/ribosomal protein S18 acetylase RimI-like enzyme